VIISDSNASTVTYDKDTNIVTKKLKQWQIDPTGFELYKEIQKTNTNIVKVYDKIDDYTFTMEYIPNVITTLENLLLFYEVPYPEEYKQALLKFTKKDIINIAVAMQSIWIDGLKISKNLPEEDFFLHKDLRFGNVLVIKDGDSFDFKIIDPDSCGLVQGYYGTVKIEKTLLRLSRLWHEINLYQLQQK
jgi:hypothetical protein|tara:strand:+ start:316 stop:882 length:567 start_codon:yes stop_codon:yes gene_type:complete